VCVMDLETRHDAPSRWRPAAGGTGRNGDRRSVRVFAGFAGVEVVEGEVEKVEMVDPSIRHTRSTTVRNLASSKNKQSSHIRITRSGILALS
jgi:hypothetical protein